ncbi:hypothetical protein NQ317_002229 [Molorchus minor]|uniref:Choline transporter-like protein n=1 Tax=Molorchus minor TaxID=1323400 RepID=A0ABQ9JDB3_9CUCU|nr:hypothetical protein NQ317_002229 [Molorchus minor]
MGCCDSNEDKPEEIPERKCTDIFWLCLYVLFWFLMVVIAAFSFVYGSPIRIINGYDSFGNTCGTKTNKPMGNLTFTGLDLSDKPYLFFYDIREIKQTLKICVKECPKKTLNNANDIKEYHRMEIDLCQYDFNYGLLNDTTVKSLTSPFGPCPVLPIYESSPVLNRCVPKHVKDVTETVLSNIYGLLNSWDTIDQILGDLYSTWKEILGLTILSLGISLFTIVILHCLAQIVSYFLMIGFSIAGIAGTAYLWYTYYDIKYNLDKIPTHMLLSESVRNETAFFWYSIVATIITLCLATATYPEKMVITPSTVNSFKNPTIAPANTDLKEINVKSSFAEKAILTVVQYVDASWVKGMWWIYFIGLIWTSEFIMACQQMVIAGAVAHWFYRHKYKDNDHVCYSIGKLIKYHLGSVALGSLIITIVETEAKDKGSECASCSLKCCICCFYILEKFIRYLNHNAYTAFEVLTSHALQCSDKQFGRNPELKFYAAPTLLVCIFAFFCGPLYPIIMVLDTVYLCMCQNGGEAPDGIQIQNLGVSNNGNVPPPESTELELLE